MAKIKLAVIFGGRACEHDVSIVSALQCMEQIDADTYEIIPVYIARDGAWYMGERLRELSFLRDFSAEKTGALRVYPDITAGSGALMAIERKKGLFGSGDQLAVAARIDVAMPVMHGTNGEDGSISGLLELMNVPYTATGLMGSSTGMDKIAMRTLFRGLNFPVLDDTWFTRANWAKDQAKVLDEIEAALPYPMFVKPANLGSSIGISRADDRASLTEAIEVALSYDRRVLVEKGLQNPIEVNCSVLGFDEDIAASVLEMPVNWKEFLTFDEKYLRGGKGSAKGESPKKSAQAGGMETLSRKIPAPIGDEKTEKIQSLSKEIFRALDCKGVVRIDYMIDGDEIYVGEINTIPGSLSFYLWEPAGVSYKQLIDKMVEIAFAAHAEKSRAVFAFDSALLQSVAFGTKGAKHP